MLSLIKDSPVRMALEPHYNSMFITREDFETIAESAPSVFLEIISTARMKEIVMTGVDAVFLGDDLGGQDRLIVSSEMWKQVFKERYKKLFAIVKKVRNGPCESKDLNLF